MPRVYQHLPTSLRRLWWTRLNPRVQVLKRMPEASVCAEIGVWEGDYSAQILRVVKPSQLHLIDPWKFMPEHPHSWHGGAMADGQRAMDEIYENVVQRFADRAEVELHRTTSVAAVAKFPDGYFDWVYIDANHAYEAVLKDLVCWRPKIRAGGWIAGDDYRESKRWWGSGVKRAVGEFVGSGRARLIAEFGSQFIVQIDREAPQVKKCREAGR